MQLRSLIKTLLVGAAISASSVFANTVTFTSTGFNGGYNGGEFKAVTDNNGTFITFCLEKEVHLAYNTLYTYTIDGNLVKSANDPISKGTAWLYIQFTDGTLLDSDGVGGYLDRHQLNAGLLQMAIWALEGEVAAPGVGVNAYYDWALAHGGAADYTGSQVQVLNPWFRGLDVQSVLVRVPDGGTTAMLLGLGMISLAIIRRRK